MVIQKEHLLLCFANPYQNHVPANIYEMDAGFTKIDKWTLLISAVNFINVLSH